MERKNGRKAQPEGRPDGRQADQLRRYRINRFFQKHPAGSVLIEMGNTKVICAATIEERVPNFLRGTGEGWLTAEYSLLPSATNTRTPREAARGRQTGRTQEIQRLIGRSLRSVMDMKALGACSRCRDLRRLYSGWKEYDVCMMYAGRGRAVPTKTRSRS